MWNLENSRCFFRIYLFEAQLWVVQNRIQNPLNIAMEQIAHRSKKVSATQQPSTTHPPSPTRCLYPRTRRTSHFHLPTHNIIPHRAPPPMRSTKCQTKCSTKSQTKCRQHFCNDQFFYINLKSVNPIEKINYNGRIIYVENLCRMLCRKYVHFMSNVYHVELHVEHVCRMLYGGIRSKNYVEQLNESNLAREKRSGPTPC